eukprot:TRINITY_DN2226_c0_g1_i1.p1 TRINITY_DN2226_c0_g1~~TRINITY_DN2226_c0_g1_i1.p1  ORF type:complete len:875 (+),score=176.94 TRINITY_DN2226_c0_g1_i1:43-2667(+)
MGCSDSKPTRPAGQQGAATKQSQEIDPPQVDVPADVAGSNVYVEFFGKNEEFSNTFLAGKTQYELCIAGALDQPDSELPKYHQKALEEPAFKSLFDDFIKECCNVLITQSKMQIWHLLDEQVASNKLSKYNKKAWEARKKDAIERWAKVKSFDLVNSYFESLGRKTWYGIHAGETNKGSRSPIHSPQNGPPPEKLRSSGFNLKKKKKPDVRGTETVLRKDVLYLILKEIGTSHPTHEVYVFNATFDYQINLKAGFGVQANPHASRKDVSVNSEGQFEIVVMPYETLPFVRGSFPNGITQLESLPTYSAPDDRNALLRRADEANVAITKELQQLINLYPAYGKASPDNPLSKKSYEELIDLCLETDTMFIDPEFPPSDSSLQLDDKSTRPWRRPRDFDPASCLALDTVGPSPYLVRSMELDCWLMCATTIMCEKPDTLIHPLFGYNKETGFSQQQKEEQACGIVRVRICKDGWYHDVTVDDYVPCAGNLPCFATCAEIDHIWAAILEKASAKLHGYYQALAFGEAADALCDMSGFPVTYLNPDGDVEDQFWEPLKKLFFNNPGCLYFSTDGVDMEAMARSQDIAADYAEVGLAAGYSFGVLDMKEVPMSNGELLKLVKIRNPWVDLSDSNGLWSIKSGRWKDHPEVAKAVGYPPAVDTSWMEYSECVRWFSKCGFLHVPAHPSQLTNIRWKGNIQEQSGLLNFVVRLDILKPTDLWVSIHQAVGRELPINHPLKNLATLRFTVIKQGDGSEMEVVQYSHATILDETGQLDGAFAPHANICRKVPSVQPGSYLVVVEALQALEHIEENKTRELVLSVWSKKGVGRATTVGITNSMIESLEYEQFWGFLNTQPPSQTPKAMQVNGVGLDTPVAAVPL